MCVFEVGFPPNCAAKQLKIIIIFYPKFKQFTSVIPNTFYGCHFITFNQLRFEDMLYSSVFYLVRGVEVATINFFGKTDTSKFCPNFRFFMFEAKFGMFEVSMPKAIGIFRFVVELRFS